MDGAASNAISPKSTRPGPRTQAAEGKANMSFTVYCMLQRERRESRLIRRMRGFGKWRGGVYMHPKLARMLCAR